MTNTLTSFTKKAIRFWHGLVGPIESNTRRAADATERIDTGRLSGTATVTSVADSATSVAILADNPDRIGGSLFNDSTAAAYVKAGSTASATSFTIKMLAAEYWEIPFGYTGNIDCLWASAPGGSMRVTEYG